MTQETYIFGGAILLILLLVISYFWYRFVFSIKRQLWNQKQTLSILIKIAQKSGAITPDESGDLIKQMNSDQI